MLTPRLTEHARQRCAEMGISTKVAKRIVQHADLTRGSGKGAPDCRIARCSDYPEYAVLYNPYQEERPVIVTVLFQTEADYVRQGETYVEVERRP